jgi:hypothetical protein
LHALIDEEKRRGPEGLGIVKKMTTKEEAKAKKAVRCAVLGLGCYFSESVVVLC